ncbi:hypothetical protein NitYY0918_C1532 [Nitratiruptor sp. YY09-18]|nr:hypothetical protein NitYY0918_C1532 [Nitratiruptor sp. YY09-18]
MVSVILANFTFGLILGVARSLLGISQHTFSIITTILSFAISLYASIYFFAYVIQKYRLYVPKDLDSYRKAAIK